MAGYTFNASPTGTSPASPLTLAGTQSTWNQIRTPSYSTPSAPSNNSVPAPPPAPTVTGGGGSGGSSPIYTGPTQAQIAAAAAAKVTAQHQADFNSAKNTAYGMIGTDQTVAGNNIGASVNDFLDTQRAGQTAIDRQSVQNALAEQQGRSGVLDMVGTGIRSGGVTLNNASATNSSAAEALAKAYGLEGRAQMTNVDNQYAQAQNDVSNKQHDLETAGGIEQRKLGENKASAANTVINDAVSRLAYLNQQAQYMSIPDRIAVDQEKQRIYDETMGKLGQYDQLLSSGIAGIHAEDNATTQQKAHDLLVAGTAPSSSFDYTTIAPGSLQGTGPSPSNLPIYTGSTGKKTQNGI